jgi:hypothetical protein
MEKYMSLKNVFKTLSEMFDREKADYAVIGAFALYAYGYVRATNDIDFVTRLEYQKKVIAYLESLGFETVHCSNAFSNHHHPLGGMCVDMMYLEGETANTIFRNTARKVLFENITIPVVSAEHLVAMKLFAAKNNERRRLKDLSDVKEIISAVDMDKNIILKYFKQFGLEAYYKEIL